MKNPIDPVREISLLQRNVDRLFNDMLAPSNRYMEGERFFGNFQPQVDIEETDSHYLMMFDLPGISKENVKLEIRDNQLIVSGERKESHLEKKEGSVHFRERSYGYFQRAFTLPSQVDPNKVEANYEDGVLYLAVPKSEAVKPKQIQIGEKKGALFQKSEGKPSKGEKVA